MRDTFRNNKKDKHFASRINYAFFSLAIDPRQVNEETIIT